MINAFPVSELTQNKVTIEETKVIEWIPLLLILLIGLRAFILILIETSLDSRLQL